MNASSKPTDNIDKLIRQHAEWLKERDETPYKLNEAAQLGYPELRSQIILQSNILDCLIGISRKLILIEAAALNRLSQKEAAESLASQGPANPAA